MKLKFAKKTPSVVDDGRHTLAKITESLKPDNFKGKPYIPDVFETELVSALDSLPAFKNKRAIKQELEAQQKRKEEYDVFADDEESPYIGGRWNLWDDGLTKSMIEKWMTCPEKFRLSTVVGLEPIKDTGIPIDFGNFFHETMDGVYTAFKDAPDKALFRKGIEKIVVAARKKSYKTKADILRSKGFPTTEWDSTTQMCEAVIDEYFEFWDEDFNDNYEWVSLEQEFEFLLSGFKFPIKIRGKMDRVRRIGNKLWLYEMKTKGNIHEESVLSIIKYDIQVMLYLWILWKQTGEVPGGVVYDCIKRPQLKHGKKESLAEFYDRIQADVISRKDTYFQRFEGEITEDDLVAFEKELMQIVGQIVRWWEGGFHYKNCAACQVGFIRCDFIPLCGQSDSDAFRKRERIFPELTQVTSK